MAPTAPTAIKAILFDFMGTCLDWHTGALSTIPTSIPPPTRSQLALRWRQTYFDVNTTRIAAALPVEDIDITLVTALHQTLDTEFPQYKELFDDETVTNCVAQWHRMPAWPEVSAAIEGLKESGYQVFVFANGTTRLQLDLCRSSGLRFDMLFSSQLLGVLKPTDESYARLLELVKLTAEECVMVAAHVTDLRGAKRAGMKTVYMERWTDDIEVDKGGLREKGEVDAYLEDMVRLPEVVAELDVGRV